MSGAIFTDADVLQIARLAWELGYKAGQQFEHAGLVSTFGERDRRRDDAVARILDGRATKQATT